MRTVSRILFLIFFGLAIYAMFCHEWVVFVGFFLAACLVPVVAGTIIMLNANLRAAQQREDLLFSPWAETPPEDRHYPFN